MLRILTYLLFFTSWRVIAFAQGPSMASAPDSALAEALSRVTGQPLVLDELLARVQQNSPAARAAHSALASARAALMRERGIFDPELFAELSNTSEKLPSASPFSGAAVLHPETQSTTAGARIKLPIGTELSASVIGSKIETNSAFASLNPEYDARATLSIRQPLLRGFGPAGWGEYDRARKSFRAAEHRYQDALAALRSQAEAGYWELYAAERDFAVAIVTRDLALTLKREADLRAQVGTVGPNQVNNAAVFLSEQELFYLDAEDQLSRSSDALAALMNQRPESFPRYRTTGEPPLEMTSESAESAVARALAANHELLAAELEVRALEAQVRAAKWDALPTADLFGNFGGNGLAGTGRDVIFGSDTLRNSLDTKMGDALDQALQRDYPSWTIGVSVNIPLLRREQRGKRDVLRADLSRAVERYTILRDQIENQVRAAHREVAAGRDRVGIARQGVTASNDQVRIGMIEYKNGMTTAFELVRLGADLANSQRRYSQALVRKAKASAELKYLAP
jgi:outer membrane protein TolC